MKIHKSKWTNRPCPICGENDYIFLLGAREYNLLTKSEQEAYEFLISDSVCERCGFIFVRKVPEQSFINDYYANAKIQSSTNFNYANRRILIESFSSSKSLILEVGPGNKGLSVFMKKRHIDYLQVGETPERTYDLIAAYYVLEHIINPREFLRTMCYHLNVGGYIILEVPDLAYHPNEAFYVEHFNMFTQNHLSKLLELSGFEVVGTNHSHSRNFGFAMVARKLESVVSRVRPLYAGLKIQVDGNYDDSGKSKEFKGAGEGI